MRNILHRIFAPPAFADDEDKTRSASILNVLGWSIIAVMAALLIIRNVAPTAPIRGSVNLIFLVIILITALALYIAHRGFVRASSLIMITIGWAGLTSFAWSAEGIRDVAIFGYFVPILMAGLLLGWKGAIGFTIISILSGWFLAYAETYQVIIPKLGTPTNFARDMTAVLILGAVLIYLIITHLQNALDRSRSIARELSVSNKDLTDLRIDLEERVEQRTSELKKRASQLEAVSSVARTVASMQDLDTLLPGVTRLISQQFGFYHVGVFLLDEQRKNAVLRASNSEGGLKMLRRQHSLPLDHQSIVGYSSLIGEPRIAFETEMDSIHFYNPELPETRSEMALPLRVGGRVIGVLDVQSSVPNAFSPEDINVLATLADQVAIAIENTRLFSEARIALSESKALFERYTRQEWSSFARQVKQTGFVFDGKQVSPLENNTKRQPLQTIQQTAYSAPEQQSDGLAIPVKLRGQVIGVLDVRSKKGTRTWKQDEIKLLEAAAERAALALENARLVESAQRRAARERAIGDISTRIGAVSNLEAILQTAVEELGRKIGGATEVTLEISNDEEPAG